MRFKERIYITSTDDLTYYENNRCFTNDINVCKKLGFSSRDMSIFNRRIYKIGKSLEQFGYLECCEIRLFSLNGKLYIGDGQGRLANLTKYNSSKEEEDKLSIPCLIYEVDSEEEMSEAIRGMNMCNTNWNQTDNIRCQIRTSQNPILIKKLNKINEPINYLGINNSNACDMLLGQGSRKMNANWETRTDWEDVDDFAQWLHDIYGLCLSADWTQVELSKLKSQKFLEVLKEYIYKRCKRHAPLCLEDMKQLLKEKISFTEKDLRNRFSNDRDYLRGLMIEFIASSRKKSMKELALILKDRNNR